MKKLKCWYTYIYIYDSKLTTQKMKNKGQISSKLLKQGVKLSGKLLKFHTTDADSSLFWGCQTKVKQS